MSKYPTEQEEMELALAFVSARAVEKLEAERHFVLAIREAHRQGHSLRTIAEAAGVSHMTIRNYVTEA